MPNRPDSKRFLKCAGFTLIEVLVAVCLLGILTALALPKMTAYLACRELETFTQGFVSDIRYTQQLAINAGYSTDAPLYYLSFPQNNRYFYYIQDGDGVILKMVYLPKTLTWENKPKEIRFAQTGAPANNTSQTIQLKSSGCNRPLFIMIAPVTGRVRSNTAPGSGNQ